MISVFVVDSTGTHRSEVISNISSVIEEIRHPSAVLAQLQLSSASPDNLRFQEEPDLIIFGPEVCCSDRAAVARVCKQFPKATKAASLKLGSDDLTTIEALVTLGIDEVTVGPWTSSRLIALLTKTARGSRERNQGGPIITVLGVRGGLGTTTIVAGLGELASINQNRVVLLDLDDEYRSLSRFLRARPLFNEPLELLLQNRTPLRADTATEVLVPLDTIEGSVYCIPPAQEFGYCADLHHPQARMLLAVLETLHKNSSTIIIDGAKARGTFLQGILRISDFVICLTTNDPALVPATQERINSIRRVIAPDSQLLLVNSLPTRDGLPHDILRDEYERIAQIDRSHEWIPRPLTYCAKTRAWPGSGYAPASQASRTVRTSLSLLASRVNLCSPAPDEKSEHSAHSLTRSISFLRRRMTSIAHTSPAPLTLSTPTQTTKMLPKPIPTETRVSESSPSPAATLQNKQLISQVTIQSASVPSSTSKI